MSTNTSRRSSLIEFEARAAETLQAEIVASQLAPGWQPFL